VTGDDPIAPLLPWYAAGTLDPAESAQVESHLSSCDTCRDLLAVARGFRRLAPQVPLETLFDHVQSQRLVEFAEDPSGLEPEARRFITTHLQACQVCAEALEILEDLARTPAHEVSGAAGEVAARRSQGKPWRAWIDLWRRLSRTVLHPAPALAYLAALIVLLSVLPLRLPAPRSVTPPPAEVPDVEPSQPQLPPRPAATFIPPAFELPGEVVFRSEGRPPAPAAIPLRAGVESVALSLVTDIDQDDLQDPQATFRVEIAQDDRIVFEARLRATDIDRRGRLTLLLDPATVSAGIPCRARLLLVKPGDPRDGEEIYRRSFLLIPEDSQSPAVRIPPHK